MKRLFSLWIGSSGAHRSTAWKIQWRIMVLCHLVLMFDEPLGIWPASAMAKTIDSQSFLPGSRPSSRAMDKHGRWFLTRMERLYIVSLDFSDKLKVHSENQIKSRPTEDYQMRNAVYVCRWSRVSQMPHSDLCKQKRHLHYPELWW